MADYRRTLRAQSTLALAAVGPVLMAIVLVASACSPSNEPSVVAPPTQESTALAPQARVTAPPVAVTPVAVTPTAVAPADVPPAPTLPPPTTSQESEVVSPTPNETPEPATSPVTPGCQRLTNFATEAETSAWFVVNDNVMGGRSSGGPTFRDAADTAGMVFAGDINTNGGGFSSVRMTLTPGDLAGDTSLRIRVRTDGRPYMITLEDSLAERDRRVSFQAPMVFEAPGADGWQIATVEFADLTSRIFGRDVTTVAFRSELADQIGIMLSDSVDGPFRLEIDWIEHCRPS